MKIKSGLPNGWDRNRTKLLKRVDPENTFPYSSVSSVLK